MGQLSEMTAVVIGAGRGLGRAVALGFAREGASLILCDHTVEELDETANEIGRDDVRVYRFDLADRSACRRFVTTVLEERPGVDVLVNNAAVLPFTLFETTTDREWDETLAVNLTGARLLIQGFLPAMRERGGSVINVSSRAGISGFPKETSYCASKFALEGLTRALAVEISGEPVSINTITPGLRIKPTMMTAREEAALAPSEKNWGPSERLVPAFVLLALARGEPSGRRFDAGELLEELRR